MSPKIANLIAIETGILVGLMSWLVYSHFPSAEPRTAEMRESAAPTSAPFAPPTGPATQPYPYPVAYRVDRDRAQPVAYQPAYQPAQSAQNYYQAMAPQPYTNSGVQYAPVVVSPPTYTVVYQEPAPAPVEYVAPPPQTIVYAPPTQIIYAEPIQNVVFADSGRGGNRGRSAPPRLNCPPPQAPLQRLNVLSAGPSTCRVLSQASANVQPRPICRVLPQANVNDQSGRPGGGSRGRRR